MHRAVLPLVLAGIVAPGWTWESLHRPLHVPRIAAGAPCPVSHRPARVDFARYRIGAGLGPGPAFPIFGGRPPVALLDYVLPAPGNSFAGSAWGGQKVLWFVRPEYKGPVLVRGRQLDGPHLVRFDFGVLPPKEIRIGLLAPGDDLRDRPSFTRLRAPGCYGYQIDGVGFSRVIVFRARVAPAPGG
jgi:hypothetical protein